MFTSIHEFRTAVKEYKSEFVDESNLNIKSKYRQKDLFPWGRGGLSTGLVGEIVSYWPERPDNLEE